MALDLSIVIVNWNTRKLLQNCLASLNEACGNLAWEALVVDNDSADGSAEMVAQVFPAITLIPSGGNLGFSRGNNLAFDRCQGDFVLLLNPDTVCTPDSLAHLVGWARTKENLAAVSPLLTDGQGHPTITYGYFPAPRFHWLGFLDPLRLWPGKKRHRVVHIPRRQDPSQVVDYIAGACFLVPRPVLQHIGPLDERFFMYFEETDWCWRARQAGLDIWYCRECEVVHLEGRAAEKASDFTTRQFQKSYRLFIEKNYGPHKVAAFRFAQFFEFAWKAFLRAPLSLFNTRHQNLAATYWQRAKLQLAGTINVTPPTQKQ